MTERLHKFLAAGAIGPFSGFRWPRSSDGEPGPWVEVQSLEPCTSGIHVCRPVDLPYWIDAELWEVEVEGERLTHRDKLVVERARLRGRVAGWPDPIGRIFAVDCFSRLRVLTVQELRITGDPAADQLADAGSIAAATDVAAMNARERGSRRPSVVRHFLALLAEAGGYATLAGSLDAASAARYNGYIAAYACDRATPDPDRRLPPGQSPFGLERRRQAAVLAGTLGLDVAS